MGVLLCSMLVLALICQNHSYSVRSPLDRYKRFEETVWSEPKDCSQARQPFVMSNPYNFSLEIRMPGVIPTTSDSYYCMAVPVPTQQESYIVKTFAESSEAIELHKIEMTLQVAAVSFCFICLSLQSVLV